MVHCMKCCTINLLLVKTKNTLPRTKKAEKKPTTPTKVSNFIDFMRPYCLLLWKNHIDKFINIHLKAMFTSERKSYILMYYNPLIIYFIQTVKGRLSPSG
jgi:hypothetical protein